MTYENFFYFLCLFCLCFYKYDYIIKGISFYFIVLLSVCGIQSNKLLTVDQVVGFICSFYPDAIKDTHLVEFIGKDYLNGAIPINDLINFFEVYQHILSPITQMTEILIKKFIGESIYIKIYERNRFYDEYVHIPVDGIEYPPESCLSKIIRFFVNEPHPFFTEYRLTNSDSRILTEHILLKFRILYGYGRRLTYTRLSRRSSENDDIHSVTYRGRSDAFTVKSVEEIN